MTLILLPIKWANGIMAKSFTILDARKIKERDREIERWRECEKEREREKERDRESEREKERERDREI